MTKFFVIFLVLLFSSRITHVKAQIRFYAQYASLPFLDGSSNNFKLTTGIKIDPNKELEIGVGLKGSFNPKNFDSDLRYKQSSFSLGFNYYHTRRLYYNTDISFTLLNDLVDDLIIDPLDFDDKSYLNYRINVNYIVLRRFHFSTGIGLADFSRLLTEAGRDLLNDDKIDLSLSFSLKVYLFQIKL